MAGRPDGLQQILRVLLLYFDQDPAANLQRTMESSTHFLKVHAWMEPTDLSLSLRSLTPLAGRTVTCNKLLNDFLAVDRAACARGREPGQYKHAEGMISGQ